jgi:hypothetical protein
MDLLLNRPSQHDASHLFLAITFVSITLQYAHAHQPVLVWTASSRSAKTNVRQIQMKMPL